MHKKIITIYTEQSAVHEKVNTVPWVHDWLKEQLDFERLSNIKTFEYGYKC